MPRTNPQSRVKELTNCAGVAALKSVYTRYKPLHDQELAGGKITQKFYDTQIKDCAWCFTPDNGWSRRAGAVGMTVRLADADYMQIIVSVDGVEEPDDEHRCAMAGLLEAQKFFEAYAEACESKAEFLPRIDGERLPLEQTWPDA